MALKLSAWNDALCQALEAEDRLVNNGVVDQSITMRVPVAADDEVVAWTKQILVALDIPEGAVVVWEGRGLPTVKVNHLCRAAGSLSPAAYHLPRISHKSLPPRCRHPPLAWLCSPIFRHACLLLQACLMLGMSPSDIVLVNENLADFVCGIRTAADR
jgi:hypothetical protein